MFGLGMQELMIILIVVMVLFGGKKLPELATGMGKAIRNFKKASTGPEEIDVMPAKSPAPDKDTGEGGKGGSTQPST